MRGSIPALLVGAVVTLASPPANAYPVCSKTVTPAENELAHQKYIAGKQDYDEGNYESALRRFRDAYALDCTTHELLLIISAAHERKGDRQEAVNALEAYVERVPDAPDRATHQAKIDNLKKHIAATPPPAPPPAPAPAETSEHTVWPWVTVGVGAAALGTGVLLLATADYPAGCDAGSKTCAVVTGESSAAFESRRNDAGAVHGREVGGLVATIGGAVILVGGLVWHFLEPRAAHRGAQLGVRLTPGQAGMSLGGRF